jgi:hypothetical protein
MQVYRLEPKSGDTSDRNWEATSALATGTGPRLERGPTFPKSPWINRELTDCVPDNAAERQPPPGFILAANRKIPVQTS